MLKKNVKNFLISFTYMAIIATFIMSVFFVEKSLSNDISSNYQDYVFVTKNIFGRDIPVIGGEQVIIKPYTDSKIKVLKHYYDYQAEKETQEKALIYHENTYMQNSGVDFGGVDKFDVVSVLDGAVINVKDDTLFGKIVEIRHSNEGISLYQSLSEISVKKGDEVKQGQIIGKSGVSNIDKELGDHLHFEFFHKGQVVDPLKYFDKKIEEL
ncbi:MAG: peptidoglycan DD-metalloendopeptidase family protein [Bacilli bacterium]|nr:M23 family metallopeptidase [Bacilli bacterium]